MIQAATDVETAKWGLALTEQKTAARVEVSAGLYPSRAKDEFEPALGEIKDLLATGRFCAVGEIGIDLFHNYCPPERQEAMFRPQLEMAMEFNLPVILHIRKSYGEVSAILADYPGLRGVWHCFEGNLEQAEDFLDRGFYISFSGLVTYKNKADVHAVARAIPEDRILVETDSPYLAPVPLRGKKNEPAYVRHVSDFLAKLRETDAEDFDASVTANTKRLFQLQ